MKNLIAVIALALVSIFSLQAQDSMTKKDVKVIALAQTPGEFTQKQLTVAPGDYIFEISNRNAGTDVGFVLVPQGKDVSNPENHIKTAYVTTVVKEGTTERSNLTHLDKGTYVYFCPLNKTSTNNTLVVE